MVTDGRIDGRTHLLVDQTCSFFAPPGSALSQVLHFRESDFRPEFLPRVIHTFTLMTLDDGAKISFHVVNQEEISPFPIYLNSTARYPIPMSTTKEGSHSLACPTRSSFHAAF